MTAKCWVRKSGRTRPSLISTFYATVQGRREHFENFSGVSQLLIKEARYKMGQNSHWNFAGFFGWRESFEHGLSESRIKRGVTVFVFSANWLKWALFKYGSQWETAKIWKSISFLVNFWLFWVFFFLIFHFSMVKETIVAKKKGGGVTELVSKLYHLLCWKLSSHIWATLKYTKI